MRTFHGTWLAALLAGLMGTTSSALAQPPAGEAPEPDADQGIAAPQDVSPAPAEAQPEVAVDDMEPATPEPVAVTPPTPPPAPVAVIAPATQAAPIIAPMADQATEPAEPLVRPIGQFFSRFENRTQYDGLRLSDPARLHADQDAIYYRARFGLVTRAFDVGHGLHVTARLVPQSSGAWNVGGSSLTDANLDMHEGLIQIAGDGFRLDAGRFEMVYGDHFIIGNVGWHQTGRSFDGLRLHIAPEASGYWLDLFTSWIREGFVEGTPKPFGAGDVVFSGLYAGLGHLLADDMDLDAYLLSVVQPRTPDPAMPSVNGDTGYLLTVGVRAKQRINIIDYRAEAGVQFGQTPIAGDSILAFQGDVELGLHLADDHLRLAVEGLYASGDDPMTSDVEGWNQLFPTAHKWLGFADIIGGRSNVASGALHVLAKASDRLTLRLDVHAFLRPQSGVNPATGGDRDGYAGTEADLGLAYGLGNGLALRTNYSLFLPNGSTDGSKLYPTSHTAHFFELELKFTLPN